MATDTLVKVVLDCSANSGLAASVPEILEQAAHAARAGDVEQTNELLQLAKDRAAAAAAEPASVSVVALDADELAQREVDAASHAGAQEAADARAWVELRMKRDRWLAQTDAFFVSPLPSDFPPEKVKAINANSGDWKTFRQSLRDLPANTDDPLDPEWPATPAAPQVYLT